LYNILNGKKQNVFDNLPQYQSDLFFKIPLTVKI